MESSNGNLYYINNSHNKQNMKRGRWDGKLYYIDNLQDTNYEEGYLSIIISWNLLETHNNGLA